MSKDWYQQSINALQLNGKGERTQQAYTRALRQLVDFCGKPPEAISEAELEAYFLHRRNVDRWAPNSMRISYCGIRFFFVQVLQRNWHLFDILRAKSESRLPAVLSQEQVHRGKGAKDRFVPLPKTALSILRTHWKTHRNPRLLFPAQGRDSRSASTADTPMASGGCPHIYREPRPSPGFLNIVLSTTLRVVSILKG
jgi:site-specific recombinase XerD